MRRVVRLEVYDDAPLVYPAYRRDGTQEVLGLHPARPAVVGGMRLDEEVIVARDDPGRLSAVREVFEAARDVHAAITVRTLAGLDEGELVVALLSHLEVETPLVLGMHVDAEDWRGLAHLKLLS